MKKLDIFNFESSRIPSRSELDIKGGIQCSQIQLVIDTLIANGHPEQALSVAAQWASGGIQGC